MPFKSVKDVADAYENGRWHYQQAFRSTSLYANIGLWLDFSMSGGNPKYNAYIGNQLESTPFIGGGNNGIYTGPVPPTGMTKHIAKISYGNAATQQPVQAAVLSDYLMCYPLVDGDSTDFQEFVNVEALPRYTDGKGVKLAIVQTGGVPTGGAFATVTYTNSDGVSGRTTTPFLMGSANTAGYATALAASANAAVYFCALQDADAGVRSVEGIQLATGTGGFYAVLLLKPLASIQQLENTAIAEIDYVNQRLSLPRVYDGAYLHLSALVAASASTTGALRAGIDFIWG